MTTCSELIKDYTRKLVDIADEYVRGRIDQHSFEQIARTEETLRRAIKHAIDEIENTPKQGY